MSVPVCFRLRAIALLREEILSHNLVWVVGAGVSRAVASRDTVRYATWPALLESGIDFVSRELVAGSAEEQRKLEDWAATQRRQLHAEAGGGKIGEHAVGGASADACMDVASELKLQLYRCPPHGTGKAFEDWIFSSVGQVEASSHPRKRLLVHFLEKTGAPIVTTNFDNLLQEITSRPVYLPGQLKAALQLLEGTRRGILHLHGHWSWPSSLVFCREDYGRAAEDERMRFLCTQLFRPDRTLVFVGCGGGLADGNFRRVWEWAKRVSPAVGRVLRLERREEAERYRAQHAADKDAVQVLEYGEEYEDLISFLEKLCQYLPEAVTKGRGAAGGGGFHNRRPRKALPPVFHRTSKGTLAALNSEIELTPGQSVLYQRRAHCHWRRGEQAEGMQDCSPSHSYAHLLAKAYLLRHNGLMQPASDTLKEGLLMYPDHLDLRLCQYMCEGVARPLVAAEALEGLLPHYVWPGVIAQCSAEHYMAAGEYASAVRVYERGLGTTPKWELESLYRGLACALEHEGAHAPADSALRSALAVVTEQKWAEEGNRGSHALQAELTCERALRARHLPCDTRLQLLEEARQLCLQKWTYPLVVESEVWRQEGRVDKAEGLLRDKIRSWETADVEARGADLEGELGMGEVYLAHGRLALANASSAAQRRVGLSSLAKAQAWSPGLQGFMRGVGNAILRFGETKVDFADVRSTTYLGRARTT